MAAKMRGALLRGMRASRGLHTCSVRAQDAVRPRNQLPEAPLEVGAVQMNRLDEHYRRTLASDLMYMMYEPVDEASSAKDSQGSTTPVGAEPAQERDEQRIRRWANDSPYNVGRSARAQRGNRPLVPLHKPLSQSRHVMHDIPKLERVVITSFCRDAIANRQALLPMLGQMRAITGLPVLGSLADPTVGGSPRTAGSAARRGYVQVLRAKTGVAAFRLRPGFPCGAQAVMYGDAAHEFIEVLTTFVLPRLRGFSGVPLPPPSQPPLSPAAVSGVVSFGLGPDAMALFPQVEVNLDQYPGRRFGFQVRGAARQLSLTARSTLSRTRGAAAPRSVRARCSAASACLSCAAVLLLRSRLVPQRHNGVTDLLRNEQIFRQLVERRLGAAQRVGGDLLVRKAVGLAQVQLVDHETSAVVSVCLA